MSWAEKSHGEVLRTKALVYPQVCVSFWTCLPCLWGRVSSVISSGNSGELSAVFNPSLVESVWERRSHNTHSLPWRKFRPRELPSAEQHHCPFTTQLSRRANSPWPRGERGTSQAYLKWRHLFFLCSPPPDEHTAASRGIELSFPAFSPLPRAAAQMPCACFWGVPHLCRNR